MITVECALATKKSVYATPNTIFSPTSAGILQLMETDRVKPIFDLKKFLANHFASKKTFSRQKTTIILTDKEQSLLQFLSHAQGTTIQSLLQSI